MSILSSTIRTSLYLLIIFLMIAQIYWRTIGVRFSQVLTWWWQHFSFAEHKIIMLGTLFMSGVGILLLMGLLNYTYMSLFGVKSVLAYYGNQASYTEVYRKSNAVNKKEITFPSMANQPNITLKDTLKYEMFLRDPLSTERSIVKYTNLRPGFLYILAVICIIWGGFSFLGYFFFAKPFIDAHPEIFPVLVI